MKKIWIVLLTGLLMLSACAPVPTATVAGPSVETIVASTLQALTAVAPPTAQATAAQTNGRMISYGKVSFNLSREVAVSALAGTIPAILNEEQGAPWEIAPEYVKFKLESYTDYNSSQEAQILVYPAQEYAALHEGASGSIARLQAILNGSATPTPENLPAIPSYNAAKLFAAQIKVIQFANGSGVRFLTEYAQYNASANNADLFYQFQGLTSDGKYYIIAVLPVSHPNLAHDEKPEATIPSGGIPFPGFDNQSGLEAYYPSVVNLLNNAAPDSYTPALTYLDALIQSITIAP
jgi:hypothetical protein